MRTQVAVIGAGPAGLILARLLKAHGIETVILERRDRDYVQQRVRAGILEPGTVDVLTECGVDERLRREGMPQRGFDLRFGGRSHHVPVAELTGRGTTVYGQSEIVKDLIAARLADGDPLLFEAEDVALHDVDGDRPFVTYRHEGRDERLECDFIAGCDGFHGVSRGSIPANLMRVYEHSYPFAWVGILAQVPPASDEVVYTRHDDGFALLTLRTPQTTRLYVQVDADEEVAAWPHDRIWSELHRRLATNDGFELREGPVLERVLTKLRSVVVEPMQYGRLFLAGDSAHIVPPSGAKGLNMAVADVRALGAAFGASYNGGDESQLRAYSETCLRRVWRTQRFSTLMTSLLHRFPDQDPFQRRLQLAQLEHIVESPASARSFAESYIGVDPLRVA